MSALPADDIVNELRRCSYEGIGQFTLLLERFQADNRAKRARVQEIKDAVYRNAEPTAEDAT